MKFNEVEDVRLFERNDQHKTKGSNQTTDMSQKSIDLFRKYLLTKSENHNVGKTNKEESDVIKKKSPRPPRPLIPLTMPLSKFDCNFSRPPSLLEQRLLPGIIPELSSSDEIRTSSSTGNNDKSSKAQLTIFYAGVINVYDNVPIDKAQAIMLLAGESCLSKPVANEKPKTEAKTPVLHHRPNMTETSCKLQAAGLPIARKISVHHFPGKRRRRIISNSPYAAAAAVNCSNSRNEEKESAPNLDHHNHTSKENNCSILLSPFPSRLGYFLPVPPN